jgi:hypothetical protein
MKLGNTTSVKIPIPKGRTIKALAFRDIVEPRRAIKNQPVQTKLMAKAARIDAKQKIGYCLCAVQN